MINIYDYLKNNRYPGRGILCGYYNDEQVIAYFIMGRSENSRNRVFSKKEDTLFTRAYDESKVKDPSLIIYNAIRSFKEKTIISNGNQTDTIHDFLSHDHSFEEALATRTYEPDAPNYTPRISALMDEKGYEISILKQRNGECDRLFYSYEKKNGTGHFISTYDHDGDPLPSFSGQPLAFETEDFDLFADRLWQSLNPDNRISLYVRSGNREKIFNIHEGD